MYEYKAKVLKIYDGDTCTLEFDLGFNIKFIEQVRLYGIDTPEIRTKNKKEKKLAYEARDFLRDMLLGETIEVRVHKEGKYGRYLVTILYDYKNINELLVEKGYARRYMGGKRTEWF